MNFKPYHDRVLVKPLPEETRTAGGLYIPDQHFPPIFIVIAHDPTANKTREVRAFTNYDQAAAEFARLKAIYPPEMVTLASREVDGLRLAPRPATERTLKIKVDASEAVSTLAQVQATAERASEAVEKLKAVDLPRVWAELAPSTSNDGAPEPTGADAAKDKLATSDISKERLVELLRQAQAERDELAAANLKLDSEVTKLVRQRDGLKEHLDLERDHHERLRDSDHYRVLAGDIIDTSIRRGDMLDECQERTVNACLRVAAALDGK